jgi:hypothetical protein
VKLTAEVDASRLVARLEKLPRGFHEATKKTLGVGLARFHANFTARRLSTYSPGQSVGRRTGSLARSFTFETTGDRLSNLKGRVFFDRTHLTVGTIGGDPNTTYAHAHEFGAVIRPKRARWLTIPIGEALTPAGVARGTIRDFPEGFFLRINEDSLEGLFFVREVGDRLEFLFALRKRVSIRPSLHFRDDWRAFKAELVKILAQGTARFIAAWNQGRDNG